MRKRSNKGATPGWINPDKNKQSAVAEPSSSSSSKPSSTLQPSKKQTRLSPGIPLENHERRDVVPTNFPQGFVSATHLMKRESNQKTKSPQSSYKKNDSSWISPKSHKRPASEQADTLITNKRNRICSPLPSAKKEPQYTPKRQSSTMTTTSTPRRFGSNYGASTSGQGYRKYEEYANFEEKSQEKLSLKYLDLPAAILHRYSLRGVHSLFRWQYDCLSNSKVLIDRKNLLYSAPTTSGKTLVAEILMLKCVLERNKKAIMVLPYNAVAQEKTSALNDIFGSYNIRVGGFFGSKSPLGGFNGVDIACCTIERANIIFNKLVEENSLSELGIVVVDEFHQICEVGRGHLIELLLTKIKYMTAKKLNNANTQNIVNDSEIDVQVVGMSATFDTGSFSSLCDWLNAELYITNFRPIPLQERYHLDNKIYDAKTGDLIRTIKPRPDLIKIPDIHDTGNVILLTLETVLEGKSCLIFCNTKKGCEQLSENIAKIFRYVGTSAPEPEKTELRKQLNTTKIEALVSQLKDFGVEQSLLFSCSMGVAYHHAGLSTEERSHIELAFKRGIIRVIAATTTLSAGVNLPAGRVIIRSPVAFNSVPLDPLVYQQMCGRSGRLGFDNQGESILICEKRFEKIGKSLMKAPLPPVKSSLLGESGKIELTKQMKKVILESIALGTTKTLADVYQFAQSTLLNAVDERVNKGLKNPGNDKTIITECIDFLVDKQFIEVSSVQDENSVTACEYKSTRLGEACLASGFPPDKALLIVSELEKAQECFVLSCDLHLIYQIAPYPSEKDELRIDYLHQFFPIWNKLNEKEQKVGKLVGICEAFITAGGSTLKNQMKGQKAAIHHRFFTALVLSDLVKEMPVNEIAEKYSLDKGYIQTLQKNAGSLVGMIIAFCNRLGWSSLELLLKQFEERLELGVQKELLDFLKLSIIDKQKARTLYDSNIKNLDDLALADINQLEKTIHTSNPFQRDKKNNKSLQLSSRQEAHLLITEARNFLETKEPERFKALKSSLINRNNIMAVNNLTNTTSDSNTINNQIIPESESQSNSHTNILQQLGEKNSDDDKEGNSITSNISTDIFLSQEKDAGVVLDESETDFEDDDDETDYNEDTDVEEKIPASSESGICTSGSTTGGKNSQQQQQLIEKEVPKIININNNNTITSQIPQVQNIISVESLPVNFFENNKLISLGIKLAVSSQQTQLTSGIGSRLIRKLNLQTNKGDSLILFDGGPTIWELSVDLKEESAIVDSIFEKMYNGQCQIVLWNAKEALAKLYYSYANFVVDKILSSKNGLVYTKKVYDPKIAQWLYYKWDTTIDSDNKDDDNSIQEFLIEQHFDASQIKMIENITWTHEVVKQTFLSFKFMEKLKGKLIQTKLWEHFIEIEMPSVFPVLAMELKGFKFDLKELEKLKKNLMFKSAILELKSFQLANRQFDLHSLQEIKQILFKELKLRQPKGTTGVNKIVLSKLNHELPKTIREWRKVENTLQKVLPFEHDVSAITGRVKGVYSFFTVNNRLAMITEPSLQCISNDFNLQSSFSINEIDSVKRGVCKLQSFDSKIEELLNIVNDGQEKELMTTSEESKFPISLRSAFKASSKHHILLSADYSQLELRILAHFSKDENLIDALKCGDVISSIGAKMKNIPVSEVTKELRQAAKQVIYGIIYGIGKTQLALKLEVTEETAIEFEDAFLEAFPKIKDYLEISKKNCEKDGYVETIVGRKRLIHNMNSKSSQLKSRAMRQAVNSRIQGSASDVVKKAMAEIHFFILSHYSNTNKVFPILNLHDELLYEVEKSELAFFASNIRRIMQSSLTEVPLPVNIKVGDSWSNLKPY